MAEIKIITELDLPATKTGKRDLDAERLVALYYGMAKTEWSPYRPRQLGPPPSGRRREPETRRLIKVSETNLVPLVLPIRKARKIRDALRKMTHPSTNKPVLELHHAGNQGGGLTEYVFGLPIIDKGEVLPLEIGLFKLWQRAGPQGQVRRRSSAPDYGRREELENAYHAGDLGAQHQDLESA